MRPTAMPLIAVCCVLLAASPASLPAESPSEEHPAAAELMRLGLRGVYFVPNQGQWGDASVIYGFRSRGLDVAFRQSELTMHLRREKEQNDPCAHKPGRSAAMRSIAQRRPGFDGDSIRGCEDSAAAWESLVLEVTFPGSNAVVPSGAKPRAAKFNYYIGDDESKWRSNVPSFSAIIYENLYDGIDLHVMGSDGGVLKYEFHCEPGSDHSQIRIHYDGIDSLCIDERGDLLIETSFGTLRDNAPVVWQPHGGTGILPVRDATDIPARFETLEHHTYTIELLSDPDPSLPLIIDPEIEWMYYLGGSSRDWGNGIAVDDAGNALVTGGTWSTDFEGRNNGHSGGTNDAYAVKVSPSGEVQWMTYLGGSDSDVSRGITVDSNGDALLTGSTRSADFAGRNNSLYGRDDAFALKVSASGELQWMTYLGGSTSDFGFGIASNGGGDALVTGHTYGIDFDGRNNSYHGSVDAFALKVSPSGQLQWMTYLGGSGYDQGNGIAVDGAQNALVAGYTESADFEGRNNSHHGGTSDAFALKLTPTGEVQWMRYFGGTNEDWGNGIAVDKSGSALVMGPTNSTEFAGRNNSYHGGTADAFALKVSASGQLDWMTYLGGSTFDYGYGIAAESAGNALVTGFTTSTDFAGRNNSYHGGENDAYALKVSASGQLEWMTYLGGSASESGNVTASSFGGIAMDGAGNALVTGRTSSLDFAGRNNSYNGGDFDAFIVKVRLRDGVAAALTSLQILEGVIVGGGLEHLPDSDDQYLETEARVTGEVHQPHLLRVRIGAVTEVDDQARSI